MRGLNTKMLVVALLFLTFGFLSPVTAVRAETLALLVQGTGSATAEGTGADNSATTITCDGSSCSCVGCCTGSVGNFQLNSNVSLSAQGTTESEFERWECTNSTGGTEEFTSASATVTMDDNKTCTALFKDLHILPPPKGFKATVQPCSSTGFGPKVTFTWEKVEGALGYMIYDDTGNMLAWIHDGYATTYTTTGLECGKLYHFCIKTKGPYLNSSCSSQIVVDTGSCEGCSATSGGIVGPAVLNLFYPKDDAQLKYDDFSPAYYLVVMAWHEVDGAAYYKLHLALSGEGENVEGDVRLSKKNGVLVCADGLAEVIFSLNSTSWNALSDYVVSWKVSAYDSNDNLLAESEEASFRFTPTSP